MEWNIVVGIVSFSIMFVGAAGTAYQIYRMTVLDADSRGLKHPKFWGFFALGGNNSSGLIMYLIGRRKYPAVNLSDAGRKEMDRRKKTAGAGLVFLAVGAVGLVISVILFS